MSLLWYIGFVLAALMDSQKPPEMISGPMTGVLCGYSLLFMRFAWMVQPRNYLLLACHASNEVAQCYQLSRWANYKLSGSSSTPVTTADTSSTPAPPAVIVKK